LHSCSRLYCESTKMGIQSKNKEQILNSMVSKTMDFVIVHNTGGLHVAIDHSTAHRLEPSFFTVFADSVRQFGGGSGMLVMVPCIFYGISIHKPPDIVAETTKFLLDIHKCQCIGNGSVHLQLVADDARVFQKRIDFGLIIGSNLFI